MYNIHLLPALFGDSILIEYGKETAPKYILIDGGPYYGVEGMVKAMKKVAPKLKQLELLVVTHVDIDHIDGIITWLNQPKLPTIKQIWFNGWKQLKPIKTALLGALQGEYLTLLIKKKKIPHNSSFKGKAVMVRDPKKLPLVTLAGGMKLKLLSPHLEALKNLRDTWDADVTDLLQEGTIAERWKEDKRYAKALGGKPPHPDVSIPNASSIAFIATYEDKSCLFAGDTMTAELMKSIDHLCEPGKRLSLDAWKLAHHGSKKSTLPDIMKRIDAKKILISTNGDRYRHPDKQCITSLLESSRKGLQLYFNYVSPRNKYWSGAAPKNKWGYTANYAKGDTGISVKL